MNQLAASFSSEFRPLDRRSLLWGCMRRYMMLSNSCGHPDKTGFTTVNTPSLVEKLPNGLVNSEFGS